MKLHLLRHPKPMLEPDLCYGASDVPVADAELQRVVAALHAAGLPGALPVHTSPLQRCAMLARRLQPHGVRVDARLAEMDFGDWEMRPWSDIARGEVDAWAADLLLYRPGGAENVLDVARRVADFLDDLRRTCIGTGSTEALVVCHAGTIRLMAQLAAGLSPQQAGLAAARAAHRIGYGELLTLNA